MCSFYGIQFLLFGECRNVALHIDFLKHYIQGKVMFFSMKMQAMDQRQITTSIQVHMEQIHIMVEEWVTNIMEEDMEL